MTIPAWTSEGILPPFLGAEPTTALRSPYATTAWDMVDRFATTSHRVEILDGFLRYRSGLHALGFVEGAQWIDGSFLEQVEKHRADGKSPGPPGDVDVVSLTIYPSTLTGRADVTSRFFAGHDCKEEFRTDAFLIELNDPGPPSIVDQLIYWYSLFSHRRGSLAWKGMLCIPMVDARDAAARQLLDQRRQEMQP